MRTAHRTTKVWRRAIGLAVAGALASPAVAFTVATFADPALSGATPLFAFNGATLTGGWSGTGLLLRTPGLAAPDFPDAKFTVTPLTATPLVPNVEYGLTGPGGTAGVISFFDAGNQPLFTIAFASARLTSPLGFGGNDFSADGVVISGPIIPGVLSDEAFAFSFANPVGTGVPPNYTVTSSFTSSAVPEPMSLALLIGGGLLGLLRRRSA